MKKAALELSVNFLVILIISVVVLGFGIYLMQQIFAGANKSVLAWNDRMKAEIESALADGSLVAVSFDTKDVHNGELATFGVGLLNINDPLSGSTTVDFTVQVKFKEAFKPGQTTSFCSPPGCSTPNTWLKSSQQTPNPTTGLTLQYSLKKYERKDDILIGVEPVNAEKGRYLYELSVTSSGSPYGNKEVLIVNVI